MSWNYSCPNCGASLNPAETVVLTAAQGKTWMLVGFHPKPGNYRVFLPPDVSVDPGSRWDFFCPVCQENLVSEEDDNLCALEMESKDGRTTILFSRIAGERATFVVRGATVKKSFGEHATRYDVATSQLKYLL